MDSLFKVQNKYTGKMYDVLSFNTVSREVTLRRGDGSVFTIAMAEYTCYYREIEPRDGE